MILLAFSGIGKKYYQRWIFRNLNGELKPGDTLALIGQNGSGKSTLLRILAAQLSATEGKIQYSYDNQAITSSQIYRYLSWSAPSLSIYLDLSLDEHLALHFRFKPCLLESWQALPRILKLEDHRDKKLRFYSSGMLQRVKVALALFSDTPLLFLDEPTSNMDTHNASYMLDLIQQYSQERITVLASNMQREHALSTQEIIL